MDGEVEGEVAGEVGIDTVSVFLLLLSAVAV
jgi:hypothetical protein